MKLINKLKWIFIVVVVFVLILATNLIDRRSFNNINDSIVSIYEDRLVVKNIILDMSTAINKKEVAFLTLDTIFIASRNSELNEALRSDLLQFEQTRLTNEEEESLNLLKTNIEQMLQSEDELIKSKFTRLDHYKQVIKKVNDNLDVLAHIQMQEGKRHFESSQKDLMTVELFTQMEIYFLIALALIALVIIIYKP